MGVRHMLQIYSWPGKFRYYIYGLVCKVIGHSRVEREGFSTWAETDTLTGERLSSGHKSLSWIFCLRCGRDLKNVGNKK